MWKRLIYLYTAHDSCLIYGRYRGIKAEHQTVLSKTPLR